MSAQELLWAANVAVWLGILGYMFFLGAKSRQIELRLSQLELEEEEHD